MTHVHKSILLATVVTLAFPVVAMAQQEWLCDPQTTDCRQPIIDLIRSETKEIDVGFWFMEDDRYRAELVNRFNAGVPIRILVDRRADATKRLNQQEIDLLASSGIPMREKYVGDILHWKVFLFHGQNVVEFSKANFAPDEFVPITPNVNYDDEAIYYTNDDRITNSFRRRFEDLWIDTTNFQNYANVTGPLVREYPIYPIDPSMNFVPLEDFSNRAVSRYNLETQSIDAIVFRVTDHRQGDAMISAVARGVPVRIISEPTEYRNPVRLYDSKQIDRMYMGGVQIKMRQHDGLAHEALVVLHGLGEVIFGSSNWTTAAAGYEDDHNFFYNPSLGKPWFFQWFVDQFDRKWNDTTNYVPFQPLPPDSPVYMSPPNQASGQASSVTLKWDGGTWSHLYDIYFGTTPNPPQIETNKEIGAPDPGVIETYTVSNLLPGTTYYWRIVDKTWALLGNSGPTWSFTTSGTTPGLQPFGGTPASIPGPFQAENFDLGGQLVAYYDTTAGNSLGKYRTTEDVDIESTTDSGGGYDIGKTKPGEWLKYSVNVTATGSYDFQARVANIGAGGAFNVEVDGTDRTGPITIPDTGGWQSWQTVTVGGIQLTAGPHVVRVILTTASSSGGVGNYNWFAFVSSAPPTSPAWGGTPASIPGFVQAENFDTGGSGVSYSDTTSGNTGGVYRTTEDVDIYPTSDTNGAGYYVGKTRVGEWLKYTVNVTQTRSYTLNVRVANIGTGATFRLEVDGNDVTGPVSVPNTGDWDVWQTVSVGGISLTQGQHVLRLVMVSSNTQNAGVGDIDYLMFQ